MLFNFYSTVQLCLDKWHSSYFVLLVVLTCIYLLFFHWNNSVDPKITSSPVIDFLQSMIVLSNKALKSENNRLAVTRIGHCFGDIGYMDIPFIALPQKCKNLLVYTINILKHCVTCMCMYMYMYRIFCIIGYFSKFAIKINYVIYMVILTSCMLWKCLE